MRLEQVDRLTDGRCVVEFEPSHFSSSLLSSTP
jgi:hypothetical protein